jgi:uncharacterized protein YjbJ (UPF0337 family)
MNWDQVEGNWKVLKGNIREKWAKFTDDDIELMAGKRDRIIGKLQERYGLAKERAEAEADQYISSMDSDRRTSMS